LVPPAHADAVSGVIFFNNVGFLRACGHGTIGVAVTLAHLGRIGTGWHAIETPAGLVSFELLGDGKVRLENVPARRVAQNLVVQVPGIGPVVGDVAWGGNWFFLVAEHGQRLTVDRIEALVEYAWAVRCALRDQGVRGDDGGEIDHVELFGPPERPTADSRNFVLCPGKAYDRSPCGTGTSAKLACLFADGKLAPGRPWRQESIIGSVFEGSVRVEDGHVIPSIAGRAFVIAETTLLFDEGDPFRHGIDLGAVATAGGARSDAKDA
ncbi:MAG: proline racemase family protein, partial [Phycisphaerales bacterium]|nr:proline racemase family protein [Phycisphaerales bacterium]